MSLQRLLSGRAAYLAKIIRTNPERFSGNNRDNEFEIERNEAQAFQQHWVDKIPKQLRASTQGLLERIFPKVGQMGYGSEWLAEWRKNLRACHPDVFPIYFRLSVPTGAISRSEIMEWLNLAEKSDKFGDFLVRAKEKKRPDGLSKVWALLDRLMDHVEKDIPDALIPPVIQALFNIGDELIDPDYERGISDFGIVSYAARPVYHLLKRVEADQRAGILESTIQSGNAVAVQSRLLKDLDEEVTIETSSGEATLLVAKDVERLKSVWLDRIRMLSDEANFLKHPELPRLLSAWSQWSSEAEVRNWCDRTLSSDEDLLSFLPKFLQYTQSQTLGDWAVRRQPRLDPAWLESYLDTAACTGRLRDLQRNGEVPAGAQEAVSQYLKEYDKAQESENPNDDVAFED